MAKGAGRSVWLWSVAVALGLLLASEVGLRLLTDYHSKWNMRLGASKEFDPVAFFRNKPHYEVHPGIVTNEHGWRAPMDLPKSLPPDAIRILYLGDSNSVTPGIRNYPAQAEERIEAALGVDVQTVNTAVPGHASQNTRLMFEHRISEFDADHLVIYIGWNDAGQFGPEGLPYKRQRAGYEISTAQRVLSEIYSVRFLYAWQRYRRHAEPAVHAPLSEEDAALYAAYQPDHFDENLRAIVALGKQRYPHVYLATLATLSSDDPTPEELATAHFPTGMDKNMKKLHVLVMKYNDIIYRVAEDMDVQLLDFHRLFLSREARRDFTDSCHVNARGAERWARMTGAR